MIQYEGGEGEKNIKKGANTDAAAFISKIVETEQGSQCVSMSG